MRCFYPVLRSVTAFIFIAIGGGVVASEAYDWLFKAESSAEHWKLITDHWLWLSVPLVALLVLTAWGYFADKKYREREAARLAKAKPPASVSQSIDDSPNSQQANAAGKGNVLVQASGEAKVTVVNKEPASDRLVPM